MSTLRRRLLDLMPSVRRGRGENVHVVPAYRPLDRHAAHHDPGVLAAWDDQVVAVERLIARKMPTVDRAGSARHGSPPRKRPDLPFQVAASSDREWVAGYRRGLADAQSLDAPEGLGVTLGVTPDPKDAGSASLPRQEGYRAGLADGRS